MATKTYDEVLQELLADYKNQNPALDQSKGSVTFMKSAAYASGVWGLYKKLEFMEKQIFPDTANTEFLERHAAIRGLSRSTTEGGQTESNAQLLDRVLDHMRRPPAGGNKFDVERWSKEIVVDGVPIDFLLPSNDISINVDFAILNGMSYFSFRDQLFDRNNKSKVFAIQPADLGKSMEFISESPKSLFKIAIFSLTESSATTVSVQCRNEITEVWQEVSLSDGNFSQAIAKGWNYFEWGLSGGVKQPIDAKKMWRFTLGGSMYSEIKIAQIEVYQNRDSSKEQLQKSICLNEYSGPGSFAVLGYNQDSLTRDPAPSSALRGAITNYLLEKLPVGVRHFDVIVPRKRVIEFSIHIVLRANYSLEVLVEKIFEYVNTLDLGAVLYRDALTVLMRKYGMDEVIRFQIKDGENDISNFFNSITPNKFEKWYLADVS